MSALEAIVKELKLLPPKKFAAAAEFVHRLAEITAPERHLALERAFGSISEAEANGMASAIHEHCERIDASQW